MTIKKILSSILVFVLSVSLLPVVASASDVVATTLYSEDFESYSVNARPTDISIYGDEEKVFVGSVASSKRLWLKNQSDVNRVELTKTFKKVTEKQVVFEVDFLQLYNKSNGDTVLGIYSGKNPVVLLETVSGNISYKNGSSYITVVEDYVYNKVYPIKVELDLYEKKADVYVNNQQTGSYDLLDESGTADAIMFKSASSPGFTVDNVKIYMEETISSVEVKGDEHPVIPVYDPIEYSYSAEIKDINGASVSGVDVDWSLSGNSQGVTIRSKDDGTAVLTVDNTATPGSFGIKARVTGTEIYDILTVETEKVQGTSAEVTGWIDQARITGNDGEEYGIPYPSYRITGSDRETKQYKFKVTVKDQFGNKVDNYGNFTWSLYAPGGEPELPEYVSINPTTGVVKVTNNPKTEQFIGIRATSVDDTNVVGQTKVSLLDMDTYVKDKARFDAIIAHIESSLNSGSYGDTPLIADLFHRQGRSPIWVAYEEGDVITSNVMAQSGLMRTMYNLAEITGNEKYSDRVNDIYRWLMSEGMLDNGITMAWGGHMSVNMETGKPSGQSEIHEIKGIAPFLAPMFDEAVNTEYNNDTYNNGNGWAGMLCRAMISGHMQGDYKTLSFERHWYRGEKPYAFEPVWQTPNVFDTIRRGPMQREGGASFASAGTNLVSFLVEYYTQTGDEYALEWAENLVSTVQNSECTYYVYRDPEGNFIWPSTTTDDANDDGLVDEGDLRRKFYNKNNEFAYASVKDDSVIMYGKSVANAVYEHRDLAEIDAVTGEELKVSGICLDGDGNEVASEVGYVLANPVNEDGVINTAEVVKLTLYNVWTEGFFADMATTKGAEHKILAYQKNKESDEMWYNEKNLKGGGNKVTGPEYGDRLYTNIILGTEDPADKDTWVELGWCTEEEGELMLEQYQQTREVFCLSWAEVYSDLIHGCNASSNPERRKKAIELTDRYSKSIYNMLKLRWDSRAQEFRSYMAWIRPEYMRANEIVGYKELGVDENYTHYSSNNENSRYFRWTEKMTAPHNGYYYNKGEFFASKKLETSYIGAIATLCATLRDMIGELESTPATDPDYADNMEKAQLFRNRLAYMWKVLREMTTDKIPIGDIGEDIYNLDATINLDHTTTAYSTGMLDSFMKMYRATQNWEFLRLARNTANNLMTRTYNSAEQIFETESDHFATSCNASLGYLLQLDAYLLGRYDENIVYDTLMPGANFYDTSIYFESGLFEATTSIMTSPAQIWEDREVLAKKINILHDKIELNVGESIKVNYEIRPWDTENTDVAWDVYDPRVAMMDTNTTTLHALKKGKTKIVCVSLDQPGLESKEVEVIVK